MQKRGDKTTSARPAAPAAPAKPPAAKPAADEPTDLKPVALGRSSDEDLMRRTQQGISAVAPSQPTVKGLR